jgi:hypothetical protein
MKRFWELFDAGVRRLILGGLSGFIAMAIVGWTAMYFDALPEEPQATRAATYLFFGAAAIAAIIGPRSAQIALASLALFLIAGGLVLMGTELVQLFEEPDVNGDGVFTIRDAVRGFALVLTAPGEGYMNVLGGPVTDESGVVTFLELSAGTVEWALRVALTLLYWIVVAAFGSAAGSKWPK